MRYILLILLIVCQHLQSQSNDISDIKTISKCFGTDYQTNLLIVLDFFDNYIMTKYPQKENLKESYIEYFEEINKANSFEEIGKAIHIDSAIIKELLFKVDPSFIHNFWTCGLIRKYSPRNDRKDLFFGCSINASDEIICFLKSIGKKYKFLQYYYERFIFMMDIEPRLIYGFHKNYKEYDFDKADIRLLTAIHYITLNMPYVKY